jgi:transglutaminase-like putative cysteine protease
VHAQLAYGLAFLVLASGANAESHRWQRVVAGERKVGQVEISRSESDGRILETETLTLALGAPGRRVTYRVVQITEATEDGTLLRATREVKTREGHLLVEARVLGDDLQVTSGTGHAKTSQTLVGAAQSLKSDDFAKSWLAAVGRGEHPAPLSYLSWDPAKLAVVEVTLRPVASDDGARAERRVRTSTQLTASALQLDPQGHVIRESMRLGSLDFTRMESTESEARARNEVLDHVAQQLQKAPYRIPSKDLRAKIRYGFDNHGSSPPIPVGGGQRTWTDAQTTFVQVCAECALDSQALEDGDRQRALQSTRWLQSDDAVLARRARAVAAGPGDDASKMKRLTAFVRGHMSVDRIDMLGYGTAIEALRTRRGDCTEYAVLLAALGRAAGIPTRVAIGSVYARQFEGHRHVFVPHAWVQAWTGTGWQSFDAAIGSFDSTHLAFAVSYDGSPANHFAGASLALDLKLISAARVVARKEATN